MNSFQVKESSGVKYVIGFICLGLFVLIMLMGNLRGMEAIFPVLLFLAPGVYYIRMAGMKQEPVITINRKGIYYGKRLVTDWDHFVKATVLDEPLPGRISDRFFLQVNFRKEGSDKIFFEKQRLTFAQDKAEEEIMAAIKHFFSLHRQNQTT